MTTVVVGCGYLGRRVARLLLDRGETVYATTRGAHAADLAALGVIPVVADVVAPESLDALPPADRLLYCVGFDRSAGVPMRTVYVQGVTNLRDALSNQPGRFVYASATSVFGGNDGEWVDEETKAEPVTESGRVCLDAERAAGPEAVVVRYSGLYGPGRVMRRAALERGEPVAGDPSKWLNLIHIDDAAAAAVAALDRGLAGRVYLATDDRPVERREFYERTARLLGAPEPRFVDPAPGSAGAARDEANKRVSNRRIKAELGLVLRYPDIATGLPEAVGTP